MSLKRWTTAPVAHWASKWRGVVLNPIVAFLQLLHVSPNTLTILGLVLHIPVAILIATGKLYVAAPVFVLAGILDVLDGQLAKYNGSNTDFGAFLDSTSDQVGDAIAHIGVLFYVFGQGIFPVVLVFVSLFASMLSSHIRARAGMYGIECKTGFAQRGERMLVMFFGLLLHQILVMLYILVFLSVFTAYQRFRHVYHTYNDSLQ